jgi:hypothetical protein
MKKETLFLMMTVIVFSAITFAQQPVQPQGGKSLKDISNQVAAAKQSKNLFVKYFEKVNTSQVQSDKMVLGIQTLVADTDGVSKSDTINSAKIPTWEIVSFFSFEGGTLSKSVDEFMVTFYVYNQRFQPDSELVLNADGQEMKFTLVNKGRKLTTDYTVAEGVNGKDKNTDDQRSNVGNVSQDAKPYYSTFKLTRAELEKVVNAEKVKIMLSKQYQVNLRKEFRATFKTMLDISTVN